MSVEEIRTRLPNVNDPTYSCNSGIFGAFHYVLNSDADVGNSFAPRERQLDILKAAIIEASISGNVDNVQLQVELGSRTNVCKWWRWTGLHLAALSGLKEVVSLQLDSGHDINAVDKVRNTALHIAAKNDHIEAMKLLLERGADVNSINGQNETALSLAVTSCNMEMISLVLNFSANVKAKNRVGENIMHTAARIGDTEVIKLLIDHGAAIDEVDRLDVTALQLAASFGHEKVVSLILDHGANIDAADCHGNTALHLSSEGSHMEVMSLLLTRGANKEARNMVDETALHISTYTGQKEVVATLIQCGVNINIDAADCQGKTAVHIVAKFEHVDLLPVLVANDANINAKTRDGCTALFEAAYSGSLKMINLLLENGADTEVGNIDGWTPLFVASKNARLDIISRLLEYGANADATDNQGWTALHRASDRGDANVVSKLLEGGAKKEIKNENQHTALHIATNSNHLDVVSHIIKSGADINALDHQGYTVLHTAALLGHADIASLLLHAGATMGRNIDGELSLLYIATEIGNSKLVEIALEHQDSSEVSICYQNKSLHMAAQLGHVGVVSLLLEKTGDIDAASNDGKTVLHTAVTYSQTEVALMLLKRGANANARDKERGWTPLFLAAHHSGLISMLVHYGADIEAKSKTGESVLFYYVSIGQLDSILLLLNIGCNIEEPSPLYSTALQCATDENDPEVVTVLLDRGLDPNTNDDESYGSLHTAVGRGNIKLAELLLDRGADCNAEGYMDRTSLHVAVKEKNVELIVMLLDRGADLEAKDYFGWTALQFACAIYDSNECLKITSLLLDRGANTEAQNNDQKTALFHAVQKNHTKLVTLLLDNGAMVNVTDQSGKTLLDLVGERNNVDLATVLVAKGATIPNAWDQKCYGQKVTDLLSLVTENLATNRKEMPFMSASHNNVIAETEVNSAQLQVVNTRKRNFSALQIDCKYGKRFPLWKRLRLEGLSDNNSNQHGQNQPMGNIVQASTSQLTRESFSWISSLCMRYLNAPFVGTSGTKFSSTKPDGAVNYFDSYRGEYMDNWATKVIESLINLAGAKLDEGGKFFVVKLQGKTSRLSPKWAFQFDKMKGIVRQPGLLVTQVPHKQTTFSIPEWHKSDNNILRFIDAVYVCRSASGSVTLDEFSDILGGPEQNISQKLHATLIAGLSIIGVIGNQHNIEPLVHAILGDDFKNNNNPNNFPSSDWKIKNRIKCGCMPDSLHRPLSPLAAAKAVGIEIWKERSEEIVTRVWDLVEDKLVDFVDAREVVFITHRWVTEEIGYNDLKDTAYWTTNRISTKSKKLQLIREALLQHTQYVWMDTICIDKANLSELDKSIRSMYKWYANCRAVVLEPGTTLKEWKTRGWCLQEGAAANALYAISNGSLISIQKLATEQEEELCELDLSLYYRPGNAAEILARMDRRKTTQKEDMAYALTGIFSVHLTLAYGEGYKARERLLKELAVQMGDLSFLSFSAKNQNIGDYLPRPEDELCLVAQCKEASTPAMVSHFGLTIEVQFIDDLDSQRKVLENLKSLTTWNFNEGKSMGATELIMLMTPNLDMTIPTNVAIAIVHSIRSIMVLEIHGEDRHTGGGAVIKCCHRLQCCQVEQDEFDRMFSKFGTRYERIWLGNKPHTWR